MLYIFYETYENIIWSEIEKHKRNWILYLQMKLYEGWLTRKNMTIFFTRDKLKEVIEKTTYIQTVLL